jgi:polar amino acid transport system substrate-binding protein
MSLPFCLTGVQATPIQKILVGDTAPFSFVGADKNLQGLVYDVVTEASKLLPVPLSPRLVPFKRAFFELPRSEHSLIMPPARIPSRENSIKWIAPIANARLMVMTRANFSGNIADIASARKLSVGALSAPGLEELYTDLGFHNIQQLATNEAALAMLMAERFDALLTVDCSICYLMKQQGFDEVRLREGAVIKSVQLWLGASLDFPESEAQAWRNAVRAVKKDHPLVNQIFAKYGSGPHSIAG